jgi:hypothetical protein
MEQILERVKRILLNPKEAWEEIRVEETTTAQLIRSYLVYLAAVPAISSFIGGALVGYPIVGRRPIGEALLDAVFIYLLTLIAVWVVAQVINWLAPNFGGTKGEVSAMKLAVYSSTPYLAAGIFLLIPSLSVLHLLASLYGIYLIYLGLPVLMESPKERTGAYTVAAVLAVIGVWVLALIVRSIFGLAGAATRPW